MLGVKGIKIINNINVVFNELEMPRLRHKIDKSKEPKIKKVLKVR